MFWKTLYLEYSCKSCEQAFILIKLIIFVIKMKTRASSVHEIIWGLYTKNRLLPGYFSALSSVPLIELSP